MLLGVVSLFLPCLSWSHGVISTLPNPPTCITHLLSFWMAKHDGEGGVSTKNATFCFAFASLKFTRMWCVVSLAQEGRGGRKGRKRTV